MSPKRHSGSITVEFAFALPIVLVLLAAVVEWGWLLAREAALVQVVREAAHAGARTPQEDDPEAIALLRARADLQAAGFDPDAASLSASVYSSGTAAEEVIELSLELPYEPIVGLLPIPAQLRSEITMRLEDQ
jgi:uncharacterized membrane protein